MKEQIMSTTSINLIYKTKAVLHSELSNGNGSAPPLWAMVCQEHLNEKFTMFNNDQFKRLDKTPLNKDIPLHRRLAYAMTCDYSGMPVDKLPEFAKAFRQVHDDILTLTDWEWSHWKAIANELDAIHRKHDKRLDYVGIGCTSVCDLWEGWKPSPDTEPWNAFEYVTRN